MRIARTVATLARNHKNERNDHPMSQGLALNAEMILVLGLVMLTLILFSFEWLRADLVALLMLVVIGIANLVPAEHLFSGFAGNAVIAIMATMILGGYRAPRVRWIDLERGPHRQIFTALRLSTAYHPAAQAVRRALQEEARRLQGPRG